MGFCTLDTLGHWMVNGTHIYVPTSVDFDNENIVGPTSGRAESGRMHIAWVRPTVRTIKLSYSHLTGNEKELLHNLMQGKEFTLTYWDCGIKTMSAYGGKDSYKLVNINSHPNENGEYESYSIPIVEI